MFDIGFWEILLILVLALVVQSFMALGNFPSQEDPPITVRDCVVVTFAPGMDADIVVWDPNGHTKLGINDKHHMNMDHSAWEGFEIDGKCDTVMSRGMVVMENDTFVGRVGHGRYVQRGLSSYLH